MPIYNPGTEYRRTGSYGRRKHPITGAVTGHSGDDWAAPANTPIRAAYDGVVVKEDYQFNRAKGTGWGNYIVLEHDVGGKRVETRYAHMIERSSLKRGEVVKKDQVIGKVGSTGGSTGNHLHFEVIVAGEYTNPSAFDFSGVNENDKASGWSYPFALPSGKDALSAVHYIQALYAAPDGHYPVGANGIWHGGIHFGDETGASLAQGVKQLGERSGVRSVADGEVIAYRLNNNYPVIEYTLSGRKALYSNGFVLVRHKLVLPRSARIAKSIGSAESEASAEDRLSASYAESVIAAQLLDIEKGISAAGGAKEKSGAVKADTAKMGPSEESEEFVFYSLYMHLLNWSSYAADGGIPRPGYWLGSVRYEVSEAAAEDHQSEPRREVELPRFEFNRLPSVSEGDAPWDETRLSDNFAGDLSSPDFGLLLSNADDEMEHPANPEMRAGLNIRSGPNGKLLGLLSKGAQVRFGEIQKIGKRNSRWGRIAELFSGEVLPTVIGDAVDSAAAEGWVYLEKMKPIFDKPESMDTVVVLKEPHAVKAGTILGQVGEYQGFELARAAPTAGLNSQLHLEVFSTGDLPGFVGRCRAYAARLPREEKTTLVLQVGVQLVQVAAADVVLKVGELLTVSKEGLGVWVEVKLMSAVIVSKASLKPFDSKTKRYGKDGPLFSGWYVGTNGERTEDPKIGRGYPNREVLSPANDSLWVEAVRIPVTARPEKVLVQDLPAWSKFPLDLTSKKSPASTVERVITRAELDSFQRDDKAVGPDGTCWWRVTALRDAVGWVCEKGHPLVEWTSPWAWPGFEFVEERSLTNADQFAWGLYTKGLSLVGEKSEHKMRADKVWGSTLHKRMYKAMDLDGDGDISLEELRRAQKSPLLSRHLQHLIVNYESEWGGEMAKWDELDHMMLDAKSSDWVAEKLRIKNLQWWDDVSRGEKSLGGPNVFHINPIGIISNFFSLSGSGSGGCIKESDALFLALRVSTGFEGRTELDYGALAGDFDRQATSFGLIQWNFGQNTLGPLLSRMLQTDPSGFSACFPQEANYTVLSNALANSDQDAQMRWAREIQRSDNKAWRTVFKNISENEAFRKVQLSAATDEYKVFIHQAIRDLRGGAPELMKKVELLTYVALYDLAVQQGGLRSGDTLRRIKVRFSQEKPATQKELLTVAVQERGSTASPRWVADATSRRMGIIKGAAHRVSFGGYTAERSNANFGLVSKDAAKHVCEI